MINTYKDLLQLYKHPFTLTRLGRNCDGGYVVPKELINNNLLSCGIEHEISFEEDYIKHINNPNIHCFDGTITSFPSNDDCFNWHKINIGTNDTSNEISLNSIFDKFFENQNKIFIKMDIEAAEYGAFSTISVENLKKIDCMVLEVHWIDKQYKNFNDLMNILNSELVLIHKHDNNNGQYFYSDSELFCSVYELTFINKSHINTLIKNDVKLPIPGLDFQNK